MAQLAWLRIFSAGLGHELPALTGVLSAFFAGLAAGAALLDRPLARTRHPVAWYAALEAFAAGWIALTTPALPRLNELTAGWIGVQPGALRYVAFSFVVPLVVIGPATAALGATLVALDRGLAPRLRDGRAIAGLYAWNTAGAVLGVVVSVAYLMPAWGFRGVLGGAAGLQLICAVVGAALARGHPLPVAPTAREGGGKPEADDPGATRRRWTLLATGTLGIAYEVLGVRGLAQTTENTLHTYAVALGVFLAGTAAGAALHRRAERRGGASAGARVEFYFTFLGIAVAVGMLTLAASGTVLDELRSLVGGLAAEAFLSLGVFGPAALGMGAVYAALVQAGRTATHGAGTAMAWNTLGAALAGPLVLGVLLPGLGLRGALGTVLVGYLLLRPRPWNGVHALVLAVGVALPFALKGKVPALEVPPGATVVRENEGALATVTVMRTADGHRALRVNNHFQQGGTATASAARRHALLPLLLHPQPHRVLFLGVGTGVTLGAALGIPDLQIDGVELLPGVIEVLPAFEPENHAPQRQPNVRLTVADARRFVRASTETYDVVVADLFHPSEDGAGFLYTREHFAALRARLAPEGLVCQWLPLHQMDLPLVRTVLRTFREVFPDATLWLLRSNADVPVIGVVGGRGPVEWDAEALARRLADPRLASTLGPLALNTPLRVLGSCLAGAESLRRFAGEGEVATDDRPLVLFHAARAAYRPASLGAPSERLRELVTAVDPEFGSWLTPATAGAWTSRLSAYREGRDRHLAGLVHEIAGRRSTAVEDFVASAAASADYTGGYSQAVLVAVAYARADAAGARKLLERLVAARPEQALARDLLRRLDQGQALGP